MDGIIVVNKEQGYTSNDVVQIIKKIYNKKVGHTGTLDPIATGVLPVLIGKGTLLSKYLINHDKTYIATLKLGIKTDTGDITGSVLEKNNTDDISLKKEKIKKVLENIKGEQFQKPPMYSAIKVNGKKLYEYARKGQKVEVSPRKINIYDIELLEINNEKKEISFKVNCSKGTYIRTLCEQIAEDLGTVGTMSELNRIKVGEFDISQSVKIDDIKNGYENIITIESFFKNEKEIIIDSKTQVSFLNGVKIVIHEKDGIYKIYDKNKKFIGTGKVNNGILKRDIVI